MGRGAHWAVDVKDITLRGFVAGKTITYLQLWAEICSCVWCNIGAATECLVTECLGNKLPRDRVPRDRVPSNRVSSNRVLKALIA